MIIDFFTLDYNQPEVSKLHPIKVKTLITNTTILFLLETDQRLKPLSV